MRPSRSLRLAVGGVWITLTLATTSWIGWNAAIAAKYSADVLEYQRVAEAAPGLPPHDALLPQHAQHFAPHYLTGVLAQASGIPLHVVYRIMALAVLALIALTVDLLLVDAGVGAGSYVVCMGAVLTSPYLFRFNALAPGMLQDPVFALGATLTLLGLIRTRIWVVALGLALAVLGRGDSSVVLVAAAITWIACLASWRDRRWRATAVLVATAAATALFTLLISRRFAGSGDVHGFSSFTLAGTLVALPGSAGTLASHVARLFVGITVPVSLAAGGLLVALATRRRLPAPTVASLLFALAIVGEAFVLNPGWLQGSQPRLTSLAVAPLAAASGLVLANLEAAGAWSWTPLTLSLTCAATAVASLQHHYAALRPFSTAGGFLALELLVAAVLLTLFALRTRALYAASPAT